MTSPSSDKRHLMLLGTGHVLPSQLVSSAELDQRLQHRPGTVKRISGVRRRHFASAQETAASLAARAARVALDTAGLSLDDIDCLVAASGTMDQGMPCNAALIHRELELSARAVPAFDINASCLGFLAALDTLSWPVAAGRYRCVLIVAADIASCGLNWSNLKSSAIFGDGAAAAVIGRGPADGPHILASALQTLSTGVELCSIPAGGSRHHPQRVGQDFAGLTTFRMDGKGLFKLAAQHLPDFVDRLLAQAGLERTQLDWIVPHQASHLAIAYLSEQLGFPAAQVINIFADYGNQVAASLPTALDVAIRDGRIRRGQRLLLLGTGAGLSLGGIVLDY